MCHWDYGVLSQDTQSSLRPNKTYTTPREWCMFCLGMFMYLMSFLNYICYSKKFLICPINSTIPTDYKSQKGGYFLT